MSSVSYSDTNTLMDIMSFYKQIGIACATHALDRYFAPNLPSKTYNIGSSNLYVAT